MNNELIFILACIILVIYLTFYVMKENEKQKDSIENSKIILSKLIRAISYLVDASGRTQKLQNEFLYALYYKNHLIFISLDENETAEYKENIQLDYPYLVFEMKIIQMKVPYVWMDLELEMRKENEKMEGEC